MKNFSCCLPLTACFLCYDASATNITHPDEPVFERKISKLKIINTNMNSIRYKSVNFLISHRNKYNLKITQKDILNAESKYLQYEESAQNFRNFKNQVSSRFKRLLSSITNDNVTCDEDGVSYRFVDDKDETLEAQQLAGELCYLDAKIRYLTLKEKREKFLLECEKLKQRLKQVNADDGCTINRLKLLKEFEDAEIGIYSLHDMMCDIVRLSNDLNYDPSRAEDLQEPDDDKDNKEIKTISNTTEPVKEQETELEINMTSKEKGSGVETETPDPVRVITKEEEKQAQAQLEACKQQLLREKEEKYRQKHPILYVVNKIVIKVASFFGLKLNWWY